MYPFVCGRRFCRAPRIYRPRNHPQQSGGGNFAHGGAEIGRCGRVSVFRSARCPLYQRRLSSAAGAGRGKRAQRAYQNRRTNGAPAGRPESEPYAVGGAKTRLHGRNAGDCGRAVDSRPARAPAGSTRSRQQSARTLYRQTIRFSGLFKYLGFVSARTRARPEQQAIGAMVSPIFSLSLAHARMARAAPAIGANCHRAGLGNERKCVQTASNRGTAQAV